MTFDDIEKINGKNLVDYWKDNNLTIDDFNCRCCGKFLLDIQDIVGVGYNKTIKVEQLRLYKNKKNKQYVESENNRWLVRGRKLSGKTFFRHLCWDCFFKQLPSLEDIPRRARKSSWYRDILNGKLRPPATWTSPSRYFKILFDISDLELEKEHKKFDTASEESFKRRFGEKIGAEKYIEYCKRQSYTCSKEYMVNERGMTESEWIEFNKNRACTKHNFIKRYGRELGMKKWTQYCETEAYSGCKEEYFIEKYGVEEGKRKYLEVNRQKSQSLESLIEKYGEFEGRRRFSNSNFKQFSRISQELFNKIQEKLGVLGANAQYGENEKSITVVFPNGSTKDCYPDYLLNTKIIEFNGNYWHMNPKIYKPDERIPFYSIASSKFCGTTAKDIWDYDESKKIALEALGYKVMVVWESEYSENKDAVVRKCVDFLKTL